MSTVALSFSHVGFHVHDIDAVAAFYKTARRFTQTATFTPGWWRQAPATCSR